MCKSILTNTYTQQINRIMIICNTNDDIIKNLNYLNKILIDRGYKKIFLHTNLQKFLKNKDNIKSSIKLTKTFIDHLLTIG